MPTAVENALKAIKDQNLLQASSLQAAKKGSERQKLVKALQGIKTAPESGDDPEVHQMLLAIKNALNGDLMQEIAAVKSYLELRKHLGIATPSPGVKSAGKKGAVSSKDLSKALSAAKQALTEPSDSSIEMAEKADQRLQEAVDYAASASIHYERANEIEIARQEYMEKDYFTKEERAELEKLRSPKGRAETESERKQRMEGLKVPDRPEETEKEKEQRLARMAEITKNAVARRNMKLNVEWNKINKSFGLIDKKVGGKSMLVFDENATFLKERQDALKILIQEKYQEIVKKLKEGWVKLAKEGKPVSEENKHKQLLDAYMQAAHDVLNDLWPSSRGKGKNASRLREDELPGAVEFYSGNQNLQLVAMHFADRGEKLPSRRPAGLGKTKKTTEPNPGVSFPAGNGEPKLSIGTSSSQWGLFIKGDVVRMLHRERANITDIRCSIDVSITPKQFKEICSDLDDRILGYREENSDIPIFNDLTGIEVEGHPNTYQILQENTNELLVELAHVEAKVNQPGRIDILLKDEKGKDESLFLMVVSAMKVLEKLKRKDFNIENCEEKADTALKLYLMGNMVGLEPKFKDKDGATLKNIEKTSTRLKLGDEELSFKEVYERANQLSEAQLKELVAQLQMERPSQHASHGLN